jgi:hypothetical protein
MRRAFVMARTWLAVQSNMEVKAKPMSPIERFIVPDGDALACKASFIFPGFRDVTR